MSDETTTAPTPGATEPWERLLEDASTIEAELQGAGWQTVFLEPESVSPVDIDDRLGLRAVVSADEYESVESIVGQPDVEFTAVDVYRQTEGQTTVVLAVERDDESGTAVLVPLYYERPDARPVFETALADGRLFVYLETESADNWVVFSHDDPSLFVERPEEYEAGEDAEPDVEADAGGDDVDGDDEGGDTEGAGAVGRTAEPGGSDDEIEE